MVREQKIDSMKKKIVDVIRQGNNIVYIVALSIAVLCFLPSLLTTNVSQFETILQGLGCSAFAASLMAFFIDNLQKQNQDN